MFRSFFLIVCFFSCVAYAGQTRILTLDGGGVRGVVTLELLRHLQEGTHINLHEDFDVYAGTSTGAIIAVALACGMHIDQILKDYKDLSSDVFSDGSFLSLFKPEYSHDKLKHDIKKILRACGKNEDILVKDLPKKVVITTVALDDKTVNRWRVEFVENMSPGGGNIKVVDALLESTAAPTYFPSEHGHVDGGMGMNDPALAALMYAYQPIDDLRDFVVLSVGTGYDPRFIKGNESWGLSQWLATGTDHSGYPPLLNLIMDVETQIPEQVLSKMLGSRYRKVNISLPEPVALDDYKKIHELIKDTQKFISQNLPGWHETIVWVDEHIGNH